MKNGDFLVIEIVSVVEEMGERGISLDLEYR